MSKPQVEEVVFHQTQVEEARNLNRVPRAQWKKWSGRARKVFNETYSMLFNHQLLVVHPKAASIPRDHWRTIAWNAAWIAADAAQRGVDRMDKVATATGFVFGFTTRKLYDAGTK